MLYTLVDGSKIKSKMTGDCEIVIKDKEYRRLTADIREADRRLEEAIMEFEMKFGEYDRGLLHPVIWIAGGASFIASVVTIFLQFFDVTKIIIL